MPLDANADCQQRKPSALAVARPERPTGASSLVRLSDDGSFPPASPSMWTTRVFTSYVAAEPSASVYVAVMLAGRSCRAAAESSAAAELDSVHLGAPGVLLARAAP